MRRVPIDTTVSALVIMPGRRALRPTRAPSQWNAGADVRSRSVGIWQVGDLGNDKSMSQLRRRRERRWSVGIDLRARVVSIQPKNRQVQDERAAAWDVSPGFAVEPWRHDQSGHVQPDADG